MGLSQSKFFIALSELYLRIIFYPGLQPAKSAGFDLG
jgi:hypothetical protein